MGIGSLASSPLTFRLIALFNNVFLNNVNNIIFNNINNVVN